MNSIITHNYDFSNEEVRHPLSRLSA
jgi:hypothetical protein